MTILWQDGDHGPRENMRRDTAMLAAADADPGWNATLRLFRFRPHGITLGRAQDPSRTLDLARCARDGVEWAVRPTGGRAIFHADEWTYSLAARLDDRVWGGLLAAAYAAISRVLVASLRRLGIPAELAPGRRGDPSPRALEPCFVSTARHEIVLGGRKLVGSAQRRTATALLQQGSVLIGPGHVRLADYLALGSEAERDAARRRLGEASAHADRTGEEDSSLEAWTRALLAELPAGARRQDHAPAPSWLTPFETRSYTARSLGMALPRSLGDAR